MRRNITDKGTLYGHKAEVSLTDYFLERRVTEEQSGVLRGGAIVLPRARSAIWGRGATCSAGCHGNIQMLPCQASSREREGQGTTQSTRLGGGAGGAVVVWWW